MLKKMVGYIMIAGLISSCGMKEVFDDNSYHYDKLTRNQNIEKVTYSKDTNTLEGMRFLVANKPDQVLNLGGSDFDERYTKLIAYLKDNGYTIMVDEKLPLTASIIAEVNKPMPDMRYIGIAMEQNSRMNQTKYSVVYGSNKFLANKLYESYKNSLESSTDAKVSNEIVKKDADADAEKQEETKTSS